MMKSPVITKNRTFLQQYVTILVLFVVSLILLKDITDTDAYLTVVRPSQLDIPQFTRVHLALHERSRDTTRAKGFGKKESAPTTSASASTNDIRSREPSMEQSPITTPSQTSQTVEVPAASSIDMSLAPEERTKQILREKYGMKTLEEQQLEGAQLARWKEDQKKWQELKKKADAGQDFDLFAILPKPVLVGIDLFLKTGTALCSVAFVMAGILIAIEAWSKASGDALPKEFDDLIVQTIEPNFTPGLFILLGFSVSLGIFASLQLSSQGATYRED